MEVLLLLFLQHHAEMRSAGAVRLPVLATNALAVVALRVLAAWAASAPSLFR